MTCKQLEGLITDYLEDALPPPKRLEFEAHLKGCPDCQKHLAEMRALIEASHTLGGKLNEEWHGRAAHGEERFFDNLQARVLDRPRGLKISYRKLAPVALIVLAVGIVGGLWHYHRRTENIPQNLTIDLSHWMRLRGVEQPVQQPVRLKRARLNATIRLPVGEEPGEYDIAIQRDGTTMVQARGEGKVENSITTVHVYLDCSDLKSGAYTLFIRGDQRSWEDFPAIVP